MRIVNEWNYKGIKVTVFHMNEKYSVKLENGLLEQTYKFRDGQIESPQHLKRLMTESFYSHCNHVFDKMANNRENLFAEEDDEFEFDEII